MAHKKMKNFRITGRVIDLKTREGIAGLRVEGWDKDHIGNDLVGSATTDEQGAFQIEFTESYFKEIFLDRQPDLFFKVFREDELIKSTEDSVLWNVAAGATQVVIEVDLPTNGKPETFVVRGQVRFADGSPGAGAQVRAYDKDLRSKETLGKAEPVTTDTEGRYEINYTAEQFSRAEKSGADLLVEARQNEKAGWIAAPIRFKAQPVEIVDFTLDGVYRGPSEFRRLVDEITPLLDGLTMAQLTENSEFQDITFLSNEAGVDRQLIASLAVSARRAKEKDLLQHEEYYGLFRQNLPTDLDALLEQETAALRGALENSARDNIVRRMSEQDLADFVSRVQQLKAGRALRPAGPNEPASLGDLLAVAVDAGKRDLVAKYFVEHGGATDAFWKALEEDSGVKSDEVKAVKQTLALGAFTDNHLPLVRELYQMGQGEAAFAELRGFAQLDETNWQAILQRPQEPGGDNSKPIGFPPGQESIASYARTLNQFIENAFPTAVISNRLERDNSNESPFKDAKSDLLMFFANNPEFSFTDTPPDLYLSDDAGEKLREIENPEVLRAQLKRMKRMFNITPRFSEIRALLVDDLHSSTAMTYFGERKFIKKYAEPFGGISKAREVFRKAKHIHATALNVYMKHSVAFNSPTPYVISGGEMEISDPQTLVAHNRLAAPRTNNFSRGADWRNLFGSLDLCDCRHCQSLYSPAAYFVDILKFLRDGPALNGMSPLEVLLLDQRPLEVLLDQHPYLAHPNLARRPDIEHIELTCENTNTQLPYIDLTNEILEAAIVPRSFKIAEGPDINVVLNALDNETIPADFPTAFANKGYSLTDKASVRLEDSQGDGEWIILDSGWAFSLKHQGLNEGFLVNAWPQTSWTANELRANPEHIHDQAYARLRDAVYPWNLPLNLPLEEVRAYLGHLGVQRHEVIETLLASKAAFDKDFALEYLGLAKEEADIITGVTTSGPVGTPTSVGNWDFWGLRETGNNIVDRSDGAAPPAQGSWDTVLKRVSIFLQQSGLSYKELLELLGTSFINPINSDGYRNISIVSIDDPTICRLSHLEIQGADVSAWNISGWNRIHRFVRLWRKLGWTMRDLDKAITILPKNSDGQIDIDFDALLINLANIQRLHIETSLPVVNLLAWWGDIDTVSYVDQMADEEPTVASLYAHLFSNKTVSGQVVDENPAALNGTLSEKAAAIAAALQISVEDFTLLQAAIPNDGALTLANLSLLYRHATLAKALKLPTRTYLSTLELVDGAPFATTASTIQFIKHLEKIRASGFKIEDLDYLLRHKFSATSDIAATDDLIATVLDAMRDDLRKVSAENTFVAAGVDDNAATSDPNGELTRKKLALLNWDPALIEQAIAVLNDTFTYETKLTALAPGIVFPDSLKSKISYDNDGTEGKLRFTGTMTAVEQAQLVALPNTDALFTAAVNELFKGPKAFVKRYMARFSVPVFQVTVTVPNLKTLLAKLKFPEALKNKIYYDTVAETLRFVGVMTETEHSVLLKLSSDNDYLTVIRALFDAPVAIANKPLGADIFLTSAPTPSNHASKLFDNPDDQPEVRFLVVLKELLPYLKTALSELVVKQRLGEYLKLEATAIDGLLKKWVKSQGDPQQKAIADFLDPVFVESNPNVKSSKDAFPDQFNSFLLFHKIAILILKFNMTPRQLQWLFDPGLNANWLDLNALPLNATAPATALFKGWERLVDLFQLRDALPRGEALLTDIFTAATAPGAQLDKVLEILSKGTEWELGSLKSLSGNSGFDLSVSAFAGESALLRLSVAFAMLKRLGASADQCLAWAKPSPTGDDARELKSVVRAKYDDAQWLELAKALRDPLRERQRSALVAYLVQKFGVRDANELYDDFLIDVEMSPCMMTTRIKQAISSVQLFIQRSLMNLEKPDVSLNTDDAKEWSQWRKWYRVWEANRKVLLYPENWIEPELRDDKSPFYKDLENELLQSDVTMATAEDAFLHYLEKLDQVARLEIVGMYLQKEEGETDILHVFGRTYATAHTYFYRRLEDKVWSAWEKLDLDIEGDHLIPIAWNRRLYLFWAIFTEKSEQPTKDQRKNDEDPNKYWEIKLAWSEYKNASWSPKKVSKNSLRHNMYPYLTKDVPKLPPLDVPQKPQDFSFKTRILQGLAGEQLSIECYGTTVSQSGAPKLKKAATEGISVNVQWLTKLTPSYFFSERISRYINVRFFLDPSPLPLLPSVEQKIFVEFRHLKDPPRNPSLWVEESPVTKSFALSYSTQDDVDCYLKSEAYEVLRVTNFNDKAGSAERNPAFGFDVHLKPWSPILPTEAEYETETSTSINPMQAIGEFTLDGCNGDIVAVPVKEVTHGMVPAELVPYQNPFTKIQGMQFVEASGEYPLFSPNWHPMLRTTPGIFHLLISPQHAQLASQSPFFFQDGQRTYFVSLTEESGRFAISFHPHVCYFINALNRDGIPGLLTLQNQRRDDWGAVFLTKYSPNSLYLSFNSTPKEDVDFEYQGAYSLYNWELFFHTPFLIAMQLSKNQRFEEAQKWFHYIFDPTATDSPDRPDSPGIERFWRVKPFYDEAMRPIQTLEELIKDTGKMENQINKWEANPFKPHVVARLRVVAYMKAVVMRYIDNLIAWGDQLFRRDTIESINEATQHYILAAQILGRRPESIPARAKAKIQTFHTLDDVETLDSLSNAMVEIESFLAPSVAPAPVTGDGSAPPLRMQYFCITANDKLLGYWDTVADRLFKIRHCMNIEGVERSLPIFEPEIDPGLLVRAAAAGIDISSALNDINAAVPHYRFNVMVQKASELCNDVKALGGAFLSALEKRDAEALALLRSGHEVELLKAIRKIKEQQIDEANNTLEGLRKYEDVVTTRQQYYLSRPFMNPFEIGHIALATSSLSFMGAQVGAEVLAAVLHLIPGIKTGAPTTIGATYGGDNVGPAAQAFGSASGTTASILNTVGSLSATLGGYQRRQDDWTHQADLATKELQQVKKQILAAEIRLEISEHELQNHDLQIENAKEVDEYMRHQKFTNQELYSWMVGQLSSIYFQSYQLAYDVAKRAERTYRYELGLRDSNFIQFGYWDSLKKGLLSGERLHHDLKRMDVAYLDQNKREYEIIKHISLITIDPSSLVKLKETGECFVSLPEALFDLDYPGHYMRRIKSISITIPCVTGPYAGINCTLTQLNSSIRHANTLRANKYLRSSDDKRFSDSFGSIQSIVTSSGQNDSGLFEANMRDERYLPFEGQGAISTWRIQLPKEFKSFDYDTISDVVLHLRYTARDGGGALREKASGELSVAVNKFVQSEGKQGLTRIFSLRHEFPTEWYRFLNQVEKPGSQTIAFNLTQDRFPLLFHGRMISIKGVDIFLKFKDIIDEEAFKELNNTTHTPLGDYKNPRTPLNVDLIPPVLPGGTPTPNPLTLSSNDSFLNGLPHGVKNFDSPKGLGDWSLEIKGVDIEQIAQSLRYKITANDGDHWRLKPDLVEDIFIVCQYSI